MNGGVYFYMAKYNFMHGIKIINRISLTYFLYLKIIVFLNYYYKFLYFS